MNVSKTYQKTAFLKNYQIFFFFFSIASLYKKNQMYFVSCEFNFIKITYLVPEIASWWKIGSSTQCTVDCTPIQIVDGAVFINGLHPHWIFVNHFACRQRPLDTLRIFSHIFISDFHFGSSRFNKF